MVRHKNRYFIVQILSSDEKVLENISDRAIFGSIQQVDYLDLIRVTPSSLIFGIVFTLEYSTAVRN
jgi:hypothetical protein